MKAAIRLEISKKDELQFLEKVNKASPFGAIEDDGRKQELITFYRSQLHKVFKMGLNVSHPVSEEEEE